MNTYTVLADGDYHVEAEDKDDVVNLELWKVVKDSGLVGHFTSKGRESFRRPKPEELKKYAREWIASHQ